MLYLSIVRRHPCDFLERLVRKKLFEPHLLTRSFLVQHGLHFKKSQTIIISKINSGEHMGIEQAEPSASS